MILGYENGKNEYEIPVDWQVSDVVKIKANSLDEAYHWAVDNAEMIPLGTEPEYVDGSYQIGDYELTKTINKENKL